MKNKTVSVSIKNELFNKAKSIVENNGGNIIHVNNIGMSKVCEIIAPVGQIQKFVETLKQYPEFRYVSYE